MRILLLLFFCVCTVKCRIDADANSKIFLVENIDNINKHYTPDWEDLDTRPLPEWYDKAKIGIFLHWGVYSVPSFGSEWFWSYWHNNLSDYSRFMKKNYPPNFTYQEFASMFKAEFYNPDQWAELFVKSGAKYIVLTSKHHEGFTLFPSKRSFSWNAADVGPKQDLVGTLAEAVRSKGLKFGVYHSLYEWFNPIYNEDKKSSYRTKNYVNNKLWPDIKQLVNDYKPSIIWADGDWEANDTYWKSTELLAWLYNESPVKDEIVVNDRWGNGTSCKHGDFYNCFDRYNPGKLLNHKWENAFTLDTESWGYRRNIKLNETLTTPEVLKQVVSTVSCGGNAVINVGPTKEGTIAPIFQERLLELGEWLAINGEAIYGSSPWLHQNDTAHGDLWFTCNKAEYNAFAPTAMPAKTDTVNAIYAIFLKWPASNVVHIHHSITSLPCRVTLLGNEDVILQTSFQRGHVKVRLPDKAKVKSRHAWTLKFTPST